MSIPSVQCYKPNMAGLLYFDFFVGVRVSLDLITVKLNKSISVDKNIKDNSSNLPYLLHKYINQ